MAPARRYTDTSSAPASADRLADFKVVRLQREDQVLVRTSLARQVQDCPRGGLREVRTPNRRALRRHRYGDRTLPERPIDLHAAARAPGGHLERHPRDRRARRLRGDRPRARRRQEARASPALPLPEGSRLRATLPYSPGRRPGQRDVRKVSPARRHRTSVGSRIRLTRTGSPRRPSGRLVFQFPAGIDDQPDTARVGGHRRVADGSRRPPGTAPPFAAQAAQRGRRATGPRALRVRPAAADRARWPPAGPRGPGADRSPAGLGAPATPDRRRRRGHSRPRTRRGSPPAREVAVVERQARQASRRRG